MFYIVFSFRKSMYFPIIIKSQTLSEAWQMAVTEIMKNGHDREVKAPEYRCWTKDAPMFIIVNKPMQEPRLHPLCPVPKENADEYMNHIIHGQPSAEAENQFDYTYFSRLRDYPECMNRADLPGRNVNDEELMAGKECNIRRIDQVQMAIDTLKKDPTRRSIVMNTWIVGRDSMKFGKREKTSSPCLATMHPQIVDGKLHLFVTMKTNDLYNAWALNAYGFTGLQRYMAKELEVDVGSYTHFSVSMQVYEDMYEMANELMNYGG